MKTRTTIETPSSDIKISHDDHILTIGSCFADRIGNKLQSLKYLGSFNPFGILYNPVSILKTLQSTALDKPPDPKHFCMLDGVEVHYDYHSDLYAITKEAYVKLISQKQVATQEQINIAHSAIITLGSAFVFNYKETGHVIANCHKQDAKKFDRRILAYEECKECLFHLIERLLTANPTIQIILTVSPVRHVRDTLIGNSRSKATLLNAVHHVIDQYDSCIYFPAYEIMIDDLRDYRYYENDMLHPTDKAFDYIWELFEEGFITSTAKNLNKKIDKTLRAVQHRPFRKGSASYQAFVQNTLEKIHAIEKDYPSLDWSEEKKLLSVKQS
ncbi:MAG: hypothetical protein ACI9FN_003190 [Saprospiraceae bacterium]|jgi:hypothetical protein